MAQSLGFMVMGLVSGLSLANHSDSESFLVVHALFSQDGCQREGFWEVVGHVVSPFDLSWTLPVGGGLLVPCSLPWPPVVKQLMQMITMVPGQGGWFQPVCFPEQSHPVLTCSALTRYIWLQVPGKQLQQTSYCLGYMQLEWHARDFVAINYLDWWRPVTGVMDWTLMIHSSTNGSEMVPHCALVVWPLKPALLKNRFCKQSGLQPSGLSWGEEPDGWVKTALLSHPTVEGSWRARAAKPSPDHLGEST